MKVSLSVAYWSDYIHKLINVILFGKSVERHFRSSNGMKRMLQQWWDLWYHRSISIAKGCP